jgi:hypothetical protein
VAKGDSQVSTPSPKAYRTATQEVKYGKKTEKKIDKHVTGQKFREPGLY